VSKISFGIVINGVYLGLINSYCRKINGHFGVGKMVFIWVTVSISIGYLTNVLLVSNLDVCMMYCRRMSFVVLVDLV
jgi:hypothetical protein